MLRSTDAGAAVSWVGRGGTDEGTLTVKEDSSVRK